MLSFCHSCRLRSCCFLYLSFLFASTFKYIFFMFSAGFCFGSNKNTWHQNEESCLNKILARGVWENGRNEMRMSLRMTEWGNEGVQWISEFSIQFSVLKQLNELQCTDKSFLSTTKHLLSFKRHLLVAGNTTVGKKLHNNVQIEHNWAAFFGLTTNYLHGKAINATRKAQYSWVKDAKKAYERMSQ